MKIKCAIFVLAFLASISNAATIAVKPGDNIAAAINLAGVNGTITFAAGDYTLPATVQLLSGQTLVGATQINVTDYADTTSAAGFSIPSHRYTFASESMLRVPNGRVFRLADHVTIRALSFDSSALWGDGAIYSLTVTACHFNITTWESAHPTSIQAWGLRDLALTDCVFDTANASFDTFVYFYSFTGRISRCAFINGRDHIHLANMDAATTGTIEQIYHVGMRANPIEYQGGGSNMIFRDCWSDAPNYGVPAALMGFTLPADQSSGTRVSGMVVLASGQTNAANRQRVGFEFSCVNFGLENCYVAGVRKPVTITNLKATGYVRNSCFEDAIETLTGDTNGGKVAYTNCADQSVKRALLARGRPGPFRPFVAPPATTPPVVVPDPATQPSAPDNADLAARVAELQRRIDKAAAALAGN